MRIHRGGGGTGGGDRESGPPPPKKKKKKKNIYIKNIGFLKNTGLDPLKITKLPSQHSMLGHHQRFAGGPMMACLK